MLKFFKDERGMGTVETLVITGIVAAMAILGISMVRGGVSSAASTITSKANNAVTNAGSITSW